MTPPIAFGPYMIALEPRRTSIWSMLFAGSDSALPQFAKPVFSGMPSMSIRLLLAPKPRIAGHWKAPLFVPSRVMLGTVSSILEGE